MAALGGGAERVLDLVTLGLARRGYVIALVTFDLPGSESFYPLHPSVEWRCVGTCQPREGSTIAALCGRALAVRRAVTQWSPDVVTAFMSSSLVPTAAALLGTTIPFVASEHTVPEYYASRRAEYALLLLSFLRASAVTITSEAVRQSFPALVRNRMHAIPNPIIGARRFAYDVEGKMSAIKTILAVGRLGEEKDHRTLIQAFSLLAPRFPDWHLAIVGEGSLRPQLESLIRDFQLTDRVSLPGVSGNIAEVYSQAQLFVTPSLFEGFGLVTAEAMAHGLPVVGFADCPGTKELISDNHTGLLVRGQDRVTSLAEALERLMQDPGLRLRLAVEARSSLAHCALDRVVDLWETLLLSVAERQDNRAAKRSNETYF